MKSTSCSDARKEQSQVSHRNSQVVSDSKSPSRRSLNSKLVSGSNNKPAKTLTKSSSLKLVRTLTKSPSFKPARASAKKSSRVALCADMDAQSATCSSTLKDSKFPSYLTLNPGGTEAEGTSVMKVCPYTYCSLNGHHHTPLPPLKCFLSARRRSMKTQKIMKLQALSPRKTKPCGEGMKEIGNMKLIFDEKPAQEEVGTDIFIEIYAKSKEDGNGETGEKLAGDEKKIDFCEVDGYKCISNGGGEEATVENYPAEEALTGGSPKSEIDSEESLDQYSDIAQTDGEITESFPEEQIIDFEKFANVEMVDSGSEATDMEWEEVQFSDAELEDEVNNSSTMDDKSESTVGYSSENESSDLHEGSVVMQGDTGSNCTGVIQAYGVMEETCEEESSCIEEEFVNGYTEQDGMHQNLEIEESWEVPGSLIYDQLSCSEDVSEELSSTEEGQAETDLVHILNASTSVEEPNQEDEAEERNRVPEAENVHLEMSPQLGCTATNFTIEVADETSNIKIVVDDNENLPMTDSINSDQGTDDGTVDSEIQDHPSDGKNNNTQNQSLAEKNQGGAKKSSVTRSIVSEEQTDIRLNPSGLETSNDVSVVEEELGRGSDREEMSLTVNNTTDSELKRNFVYAKRNKEQELSNNSSNRKWTIKNKKLIEDCEEERGFNPREPNYLPLVPDPEGEKVDLKHQMMDERKNSEEWMIDYALQQTVTKLAPARKRKVALLVEAFEAVMPIPKYEPHLRHPSEAFSHAARPIQACS
ncbi:hypothetical protein FNV43_RR20214 [Rhamnella rubrinervis]|uniref:Calmodulin-binding domain-containing protein n=1 Tax=Rhamnella rubrinervis TaxID=2594499 RepID=A0A8K0DZA2_9ROSA|nr:hypothetical protein FNV43_RR20214 [Rhamnella rubrinervis]